MSTQKASIFMQNSRIFIQQAHISMQNSCISMDKHSASMKQFTSFTKKGFVFKCVICARERRQVYKRGSIAIPWNMFVFPRNMCVFPRNSVTFLCRSSISMQKLDFYAEGVAFMGHCRKPRSQLSRSPR